ncbi:secreted RxLR effector protein 161-like [Rutidosis leptorrhynchoides]|uniref:secreted RxLR effector protein 161-like n=1 Tax=Rutidosis leptorrhynchoides TaxID=125765 RepID=UPI003A98F434
MNGVPYALAIGSIMYAMRYTRPDVSFALNMTSRYQQNPGDCHWTAVKNILKYLRNTKDRDDSRSQSGYIFIMNGGAVDWRSSKQSTTAMSTTKSEYIDASEVAQEAVWIRKSISGLGVVPSIENPMDMYCDNTGAIVIANEPGVLRGAKHILRKFHYIREVIERGEAVIKTIIGCNVKLVSDTCR